MASVVSLIDRDFDIKGGKSTGNQDRVVWLLEWFAVELKELASGGSLHIFFNIH